jgi:predicted nucleic acid-binding Zn ribbon protein|tara:strand:+ start:529 stop:855 length:327 start_codon:yes stop_codon:yes gene_type:complete
MPLYSFKNTKSGKEFEMFMSMDKRESYLKDNPDIQQTISKVNIVAGVSGMSYRQDQGWKENLSRIAEAHPNSALAKEHGKRTIKEVRTDNVIKKHRKIQKEKAKKFAK